MKLSPRMTTRLKQFARNPEPMLLTHQKQRTAATLYALGLLTWTRQGYKISSAGVEYLATHTDNAQ